MIVGTAGHIDHGKTSLVRALTGVDTDRLQEEKARGITIELGFAHWPRSSGAAISFVDVPGHERLVHTMLAGATGIDRVVLAVAADDGVMPQTREHVAILDLLGRTRGIVVMTKVDLATDERRGEVEGQIRALLAGTDMAAAPIVPVSTRTGEGLAEVTALLDAASGQLEPRQVDARFRLAVDRCFSLAGAGTVVTGTVLSGRVAVGDQVIVSPAGREARVRSMHVQNRVAQQGSAGERCALALVGPHIAPDAIGRGDIVQDPSLHAPVRRLDARLRVLASERAVIGQWFPAKFHHASCEIGARLVVLDERSLAPGGEGFVQIVLDRPAALAVGDPFVVRDSAATRTIGGGTILDLRPPDRRRRTPDRLAELNAMQSGDPVGVLQAVLAGSRWGVDIDAFLRDRAASAALAETALRLPDVMPLDVNGARLATSRAKFGRLTEAMTAHLLRFHATEPDVVGPEQEKLRGALKPRLPTADFAAVVRRLVADGSIVVERSRVRLRDHAPRIPAEDERDYRAIKAALGGQQRLSPPRVRDIAREQDRDEGGVRRILKAAARRGEIEEVAHDHFFLFAALVEMADLARTLSGGAADGQFAVGAFRDKLEIGRKVAIQILEFFDRQGLTMRRGDVRRINPHQRDLFSCGPDSGTID